MTRGRRRVHIASLRDKHVFITGASSGIGLALAKLCLARGAYVSLVSRTRAKLASACELLTAALGHPRDHVRFEAADVGDAAAVSRAVRNSLAWRPIDVLVCNAGLACQGQLDEVDAPRLEYVARTNLLGCVFPLHAALPHLKSRSLHTPCSVVIMGSSASLAFVPEANMYTATKHGLKGLSEYLRIELMPYNIPVTFACPPFVETPMLDEVDREGRSARLIRKLCFYDRSRAQASEEVAERVLAAAQRGDFLATTDAASFVLGVLGRGNIPADSLPRALLELLCMVPLRIVSFFWFSYATRILQRPATASSSSSSSSSSS